MRGDIYHKCVNGVTIFYYNAVNLSKQCLRSIAKLRMLLNKPSFSTQCSVRVYALNSQWQSLLRKRVIGQKRMYFCYADLIPDFHFSILSMAEAFLYQSNFNIFSHLISNFK